MIERNWLNIKVELKIDDTLKEIQGELKKIKISIGLSDNITNSISTYFMQNFYQVMKQNQSLGLGQYN